MRLANVEPLQDSGWHLEKCGQSNVVIATMSIADVPTVDAVPFGMLEGWLWEIALNNYNNPISDFCEDIIKRLPGLREYMKDREYEVKKARNGDMDFSGYVCATSGLPCCGCSLYCEHRKEAGK